MTLRSHFRAYSHHSEVSLLELHAGVREASRTGHALPNGAMSVGRRSGQLATPLGQGAAPVERTQIHPLRCRRRLLQRWSETMVPRHDLQYKRSDPLRGEGEPVPTHLRTGTAAFYGIQPFVLSHSPHLLTPSALRRLASVSFRRVPTSSRGQQAPVSRRTSLYRSRCAPPRPPARPPRPPSPTITRAPPAHGPASTFVDRCSTALSRRLRGFWPASRRSMSARGMVHACVPARRRESA